MTNNDWVKFFCTDKNYKTSPGFEPTTSQNLEQAFYHYATTFTVQRDLALLGESQKLTSKLNNKDKQRQVSRTCFII